MNRVFLFSALLTTLDSASWSYDDQTAWSTDYDLCGTEDQSPINIQSSSAILDESICMPEFDWTVDSSVNTFRAANNGHSLTLTPLEPIMNDHTDADGSSLLVFNGYRTLSLSADAIATFPNYFLPDNSPHDSFCLHSLHFHWGTDSLTGAEHLLDSHQYPLEVHFVHYSCNQTDIGAVFAEVGTLDDITNSKANGDDVHQLGVVGFVFEISDEDNPAFDNILSDDRLARIDFPLDSDDDEPLDELDIVQDLDLMDIIPANYASAGYFAYEGSLTTPPCTNIVRWHVMNAKAQISEDQMDAFRSLMESDTRSQAPNYRETQENVNTVYACMSAVTPTDEPSPSPTNKPTNKPTKKSRRRKKSSSSSSSSSDDAILFAGGNVVEEEDLLKDGINGSNGQIELRLSDASWMNLWLIFGIFMVLNCICIIVYFVRGSNSDGRFKS